MNDPDSHYWRTVDWLDEHPSRYRTPEDEWEILRSAEEQDFLEWREWIEEELKRIRLVRAIHNQPTRGAILKEAQ